MRVCVCAVQSITVDDGEECVKRPGPIICTVEISRVYDLLCLLVGSVSLRHYVYMMQFTHVRAEIINEILE